MQPFKEKYIWNNIFGKKLEESRTYGETPQFFEGLSCQGKPSLKIIQYKNNSITSIKNNQKNSQRSLLRMQPPTT
jgi:hypothetical protein